MKFLSTCCLALTVSFGACNLAGCPGSQPHERDPVERDPVERDPEFKHKQIPKTQPPPPQHEIPRK
jgi:hypothetical protein